MKILIWCKWLDDIFLGTKPPDGIGGAEVQMALWAKTLSENNNKVYTFAWRRRLYFKKKMGIRFLPLPWLRKLGVFIDPLKFVYIPILRPDIIILRSNTDLSKIVFLKKIFNFKFIYMLASDKDLSIDNIDASEGWQQNLFNADLVITQNRFQLEGLHALLPGIRSEMQPNIFHPIFEIVSNNKQYDFVWVGTLKSIKRPEWFLNLARSLPEFSFTMVGIGQDKKILEKVLNSEKELPNFKYLGYLPLNEALQTIANSKVLVNTSKYEGFPNVFLQAWYFNLPVISTVNPNDVFSKCNVGFFVEHELDLQSKARLLALDAYVFDQTTFGIKDYFKNTHDPTLAYNLIFKHFN